MSHILSVRRFLVEDLEGQNVVTLIGTEEIKKSFKFNNKQIVASVNIHNELPEILLRDLAADCVYACCQHV